MLEWVNLVGNGYVRLLQMIVIPLVFISILSAITRLKQVGSLGKISFSVLSVLLISTAIAAAIGIAMVYLFDLSAEGLVAGERISRAKQSGRACRASIKFIFTSNVSLFYSKKSILRINRCKPDFNY